MKKHHITTAFALSVCLSLFFAGCFKDEAPNAEADIILVTLPEGYLTDAGIDYNHALLAEYNAYPIYLEIALDKDLKDIHPVFTLTPGATIEPSPESVSDYSEPVRFTITSEDGKWQRRYVIIANHPALPHFPELLTFEDYFTENEYQVFQQGDITWCSGNRGYAMAAPQGATANDYPTYFTQQGHTGGCVAMTTRMTNALANAFGKPIAAGNLFLGAFDLVNALSDALGSTKFGIPYTEIPVSIEGWYKYKSGPSFYENGEWDDSRKDYGSITALLFESTKEVPMLDGNTSENGWKHENMVALARVAQIEETDEWTHFSIPFDYDTYGKEIDLEKLAQGKYYISILFASSTEGGIFKGSPGSTLLVDDVTINNKPKENQ